MTNNIESSGVGSASNRVDILAAGAGMVAQAFDLRASQNTANVASQGMYGSLCGFKAGDVITNVIVYGVTVGTVSAVFGAVYDTAGNRLAISNNFSASWAGAAANVIPMISAYTVPADAALYLAFNSTWSVQPTVARGVSQTTPTIGSGAKLWVQQTGQASPPSTATFVASGLGALWIAAS